MKKHKRRNLRTSPSIVEELLTYNDNLEKRDVKEIEMIVLHCTELPTLRQAREYGERILYTEDGTGNSGHYYVDRDGNVYRYVRDDRVAHHVIGHNRTSIGIEIVNTGRYPNWYSSRNQMPTEQYTDAQIEAMKKLLCYLRQQYPHISRIARHSDLDTQTLEAEDDPNVRIRRKIDPGPLFPWQEIQDWWHDKIKKPP